MRDNMSLFPKPKKTMVGYGGFDPRFSTRRDDASASSGLTPLMELSKTTFTHTQLGDQDVIRLAVTDHVFPEVKFLRNQDVRMSTHKNSMCQQMARWCNIENERVADWWPRGSQVMLKALSKQRGYRMVAIKQAFMRKSNCRHWCTMALYPILTTISCLPPVWMEATAKDKTPKKSKATPKPKADYKPLYTLAEFLEGRENKEAHAVLVEKFCRVVVTERQWKRKLRTAATFGEVCTVSNEAFALVTLENMYDRWVDLNNQMGNHFKQAKQGTKPPTSEVDPRYTEVCIKGELKHRKGWKKEGIERFNALYDKVETDRREYGEVDAEWLDEVKTAMHPAKRAKVDTVLPKARNGLLLEMSSCGEEEDDDEEDHAIAFN